MTEKQAVAKGAKLMDRILPGWYKVIDLKKLHMFSGSQCLLGQTFGVHAEKCLAREMYPEEFEASIASLEKVYSASRSKEYLECGYRIGAKGCGEMVRRLLEKFNLWESMQEEYEALARVCIGHDNHCVWAKEIASRLAKDAS